MRWLPILILFAFYSAAYSAQPQPQSTQSKQTSESEQRGSDQHPITVKILPSPDAETKAAHEEKYREEKSTEDKRLTDATVWLARITMALAVFTGLLWWATYRLAKDAKVSAERQAGEMQKSLKIADGAAKAAQESADASKAMVATMDDTAERQLRAYALVSRAEIVSNPLGIPGQFICIGIKHFGQTPASSVQYWISIAVREVPLKSELQRDLSIDTTMQAQVIGPGDIFKAHTNIPPAPKGIEAISNTSAFYVYGAFSYVDAFGKERITNFRYMRRGPQWNAEGELEMCTEGNEAT